MRMTSQAELSVWAFRKKCCSIVLSFLFPPLYKNKEKHTIIGKKSHLFVLASVSINLILMCVLPSPDHSYCSYMGHFDLLNYFSVAENESKARVRFNLMEKMLQPCGPPSDKPDDA